MKIPVKAWININSLLDAGEKAGLSAEAMHNLIGLSAEEIGLILYVDYDGTVDFIVDIGIRR